MLSWACWLLEIQYTLVLEIQSTCWKSITTLNFRPGFEDTADFGPMRERDPGQLKARDPKCKKMILEYQITTSFQPLISN